MITLKQSMQPNRLPQQLIKQGTSRLTFNRQSIIDDIDRLDRELETPRNKIDKQNMRAIKGYLKMILGRADKQLVLTWCVSDGIIKSFPLEIRCIPEYKVMATEYIMLKDEYMAIVDYTELANLLAFEIMHRDLGETSKSIEEKLKGIGIVTTYDRDNIMKYFNGESPYKLSKELKVSDSPYLEIGSSIMHDYFYSKSFNDDYYFEVVNYSCEKALAIIMEYLIDELSSKDIPFNICGASDTWLGFIIKGDKDKLNSAVKTLEKHVAVRIFGRLFETLPTVQVY